MDNKKLMEESYLAIDIENKDAKELEEFKEKHNTDLKDIRVTKLPWYPKKLVYLINMSRIGLKKCKDLKKFHKLI